MTQVEHEGLTILPVSLSRRRDSTIHPDAVRFIPRTAYLSRSPLSILRANLRFAVRSPRRYAHAAEYVFTGHMASWLAIGPGRSTGWKALLLFPSLVELAERLRAAHVSHLHASMASISGTAAILLSRLLERPYSITGHHGDLWFYPPDDLPQRIRGAKFFTTVAEYNRRRLLELYPTLDPAWIHVVRLGVHLDRFTPAPRSDRGPTTGPPILLTVARLDPIKGYDTLVRAARLLVTRGQDFRWHLVGDGPMRANLEKAVSVPPLAGRVELLGFKSQEEVCELFRQATLFVLPSHSEGLPVALMEALASGIPCVSTPVNGIPEIIQNGVNGLLIPPGDPQALAEAIATILNDRGLRSSMAAAARPSMEKDYDIRRTGRMMAALFRAPGNSI